MKSKDIGIQELIEQVKSELLNTSQEEEVPLFAISEVEIEITFTVERTAQGGINLQVVQSGVEKAWADAQKVRIRLEGLVTPEQIRKKIKLADVEHGRQILTRETKID